MAGNASPFGLFERMLAGRYLRARRQYGGVALISVISVVAITLAVMALIITMSVMNGFRETLLSRILGVNGHIYIDTQYRTPDEVARYMAAARETPGVLEVTPMINAQALATSDATAVGVYVRGIRREDLAALDIVMNSVGDRNTALVGFEGVEAPTVLIGDRLATMLGVRPGMGVTLLSPQPAATTFGLTPRRKSFPVGAVFSVGMAEFDAGLVYMPLEQAQILFGRNGPDELELRVSNPERTHATMMDLRSRVGPDVTIYDWRVRSQGLADALVVERNVMRLILMILVAIAALNIVTGLIMLVKNKSRDIAILRTMGATKGAILRIFFMASASLGLLGLSLGLVLGIGFCLNIEGIQTFIEAVTGFDPFPGTVYSLETLPARVEWSEVALISFFTIAITFAATFATSWWAARFDPVESLRYE